MSSTKYTDATGTAPGTLVVASWLNDVDTSTYASLNTIVGTNTITARGPNSLVAAYPINTRFFINPANTNTGPATISINSLATVAISKFGVQPLVAGDLVAGTIAAILYDGSEFQLLNPQASAAPGVIVPIAQGGTGATTAAAARTNLNVAAIGPTFSVNRTTNQSIPGNTFTEIVFPVALFDTTSAVNLSTGRFTPNVAGYYHFDTSLARSCAGGVFQNEQVFLYKNGVQVYALVGLFPTIGDAISTIVSGGGGTIFLNGTTDYVSVFAYTSPSAGSVTIGNGSYFTGHFLHP